MAARGYQKVADCNRAAPILGAGRGPPAGTDPGSRISLALNAGGPVSFYRTECSPLLLQGPGGPPPLPTSAGSHMASHSRPRLQRWAPFTLALAFVAVARVAHAAWPSTPTQNVPLCTTIFSSQIGSAIPDQHGGAIAVWYEDRAGDFDIFARRVDSAGTPRWTADGVLVCVAPAGTQQVLPKAVSDGAGGAIVAWIDGRNGPNTLFA